jgi:putative Mn2+ efflux pump MntP
MIEILFLAVALSIDASVVSFSQGLCFNENKRKNSLLLAFFVG